MPPSGHSHSSHSSSHSSFSSHSSSSRSFSSSSSRSYSSSSRSSSGSRGPSSHSSSSMTSKPKAYVPPARPRVNQPSGFRPTGGMGARPTHYYGRRHDYIYYPVAWVDSSTGSSYQAGYYDENGNRYDNVSFQENGKYKNVVCHCDYCGQDTVMDLSAEEAKSTEMKCPNCGGPLLVKSFLDEEINANRSGAAVSDPGQRRKRRGVGCLVAVVVFLVLVMVGSFINRRQAAIESLYVPQQIQTVPGDQVSDTLHLVRGEGSSYRVAAEGDVWDKELVWDADADSFYDEATEGWAWYNTDMYPAVWQYWYEGISSDFGDYGWMEHDSDGWYIEASEGNWIPLPDGYDTGRLWYIEEN